jgi:hypothetical protein
VPYAPGGGDEEGMLDGVERHALVEEGGGEGPV